MSTPVICTMPGCQTTAGCICSRSAQARSVQTFRLRRRRESITAVELLEWYRSRPGCSWQATINDVNRALDEICDA